MRIDQATIDRLGGLDAVAKTVADFAAAMDAHRLTVGHPAPTADPTIEAIWRAGGIECVAIIQPGSVEAGTPAPPRTTSALDFRRRFTASERAAITLAASRALDAGDPTLQVWIDDINAAGSVHLDAPEVATGLGLLVAAGLLAEDRVAVLLA